MSDPKPTVSHQPLARQRAKLIIQVRSGSLSAQEAARQLRTSRKSYYKWERRALAAMAEALGNRKRPTLRVDPEKETRHSLLVENNEFRIRERQLSVFMRRFALGDVTPERLKQHVGNTLSSKDLATLYSCLTGRSRCKRIRALIVVFHLCGVPTGSMVNGLGIYSRTVTKHIRIFRRDGVDALFPARKGVVRWEDPKYKDALFGILHSPPRDHGFNRTTWRGKDLASVMVRIGMPIGNSTQGRVAHLS